tara:strand:+ start:382 stop:660 length:279 start_codon:yes stop_codon:yes gene_type:complete
MINEIQKDLFNNILKNDWEKEWKNMPEFIQENKIPIKQITVNFRKETDLKEFSKLIGQNITPLTKSISFPLYEKEKPGNYLYTYIKPQKNEK